MDIKQINSAIITGTFTDTELQSILDAVRFNRSRIRETVKRTLVKGATVRFNSTRLGAMMGTVESVGIKNAVVRTARGGYKVPMNMLEII